MKKAQHSDGHQVLAPIGVGEIRDYTILWSERDLGTSQITGVTVEVTSGDLIAADAVISRQRGSPYAQATTFRLKATGDVTAGRAQVFLRVQTDRGEILNQTFWVPVTVK